MSRQPNSMFFRANLVQKMTEDLQMIGRSKRTQQAYLRAVRKLAEFCRKSPDQVFEQQVRRQLKLRARSARKGENHLATELIDGTARRSIQ